MGKRNAAGACVLLALLIALPPLLRSHYLTGVLIVCAIDGIWAASWDSWSFGGGWD